MLCFRDREIVLDVFEKTTGNRILHGINLVGGVIRDIGPEYSKDIAVFCDLIEKKCLDLQDMIVKSYTIKQRMQGVGIMSEKLARDLCVVGPVARGSNVPYDVRYDAPYLCIRRSRSRRSSRRMATAGPGRSCACASYSNPSTSFGRACHCWTLRLRRSSPSQRFYRTARTSPVWKPPRGELFYYVRAKRSKELDRVKIRTSTYANGSGIVPLIKGEHLADVGLITITFDPCIGCFDR